MLRRADTLDNPVFLFDEVRRWPAGVLNMLTECSVLDELCPADSVACDSCPDNHLINVDICEYPTGTIGMGKCPECGRIQVPLDRLRQWGLNFGGLARLVKIATEAKGRVGDVSGDRIWALGHVVHDGVRIELFLARGLARQDAQAVVDACEAMSVAASPTLLTPAHPPRGIDWPGRRPRHHLLVDLLELDNGTLRLDRDLLLAAPASESGSTAWLTVSEAGDMLCDVVSGLEPANAQARVSKAAGAGKFKTNGKKRMERRIDRDTFNTWRFEQREKDLAASDW